MARFRSQPCKREMNCPTTHRTILAALLRSSAASTIRALNKHLRASTTIPRRRPLNAGLLCSAVGRPENTQMVTSKIHAVIAITGVVACGCDEYSDEARKAYEAELVEHCRSVSDKPVIEVEQYADIKIPYMDECVDKYDGVTCPTNDQFNQLFSTPIITNDRGWSFGTNPGFETTVCCGRVEKDCYSGYPKCGYYFQFGPVPPKAIPPDCEGTAPTYRCWVDLDARDWRAYALELHIQLFDVPNLERRDCPGY